MCNMNWLNVHLLYMLDMKNELKNDKKIRQGGGNLFYKKPLWHSSVSFFRYLPLYSLGHLKALSLQCWLTFAQMARNPFYQPIEKFYRQNGKKDRLEFWKSLSTCGSRKLRRLSQKTRRNLSSFKICLNIHHILNGNEALRHCATALYKIPKFPLS